MTNLPEAQRPRADIDWKIGNELNQGYCKLHNLLKSSGLGVAECIPTFLHLDFVVRRSMSGNFGVH
jgi:hypothetical protein